MERWTIGLFILVLLLFSGIAFIYTSISGNIAQQNCPNGEFFSNGNCQYLPDDTRLNLVGYWPVNTGKGFTVYDVSSYWATIKHDGKMTGNVTWVQNCFFQNCVYVSEQGTAGVIETPSFAQNFSSITYSAWVKIPSTVPNVNSFNRITMSDGDIGTSGRIALGFAQTSAINTFGNATFPECFINDPTHSFQKQVFSTATTPNQWSFLTCVYTGNQALIYINGTLSSSYSYTYNIRVTNNFTLGSDGTTNRRSMEGNLVECRFYDYALSQTQVSTLFQYYVDELEGI